MGGQTNILKVTPAIKNYGRFMHYYYVIYGENYYRRAGSPVAYNDTIHRSEKQSKKPENFTARAGSQTILNIVNYVA